MSAAKFYVQRSDLNGFPTYHKTKTVAVTAALAESQKEAGIFCVYKMRNFGFGIVNHEIVASFERGAKV
jgi:hypothetical protein